MTLDQVLAHFETQVAIAEALRIRQPSVAEWFDRGYVPIGRQYQLQIITGGKLQADPDSVPSRQTA